MVCFSELVEIWFIIVLVLL